MDRSRQRRVSEPPSFVSAAAELDVGPVGKAESVTYGWPSYALGGAVEKPNRTFEVWRDGFSTDSLGSHRIGGTEKRLVSQSRGHGSKRERILSIRLH
jgi:hypothetical protein